MTSTHHRPHALYRFYADDDTLLYVGITLNPGTRWPDHRDHKPWWTQVARIELTTYPDRAAVLEAERQAIIAEQPRHNVVHNRKTTTGATISTPQLDRLDPIQPGDWAALGLADGRCPVGEIIALNDTWVSLRLKNWWEGTLTHEIVAVRWAEVRRVELAYPEDADEDRALGIARRVMDDQHLGDFQTAWTQFHIPDGDPVRNAFHAWKERNES